MSWVPVAACLPLPRTLTRTTILDTDIQPPVLARADKPPMAPGVKLVDGQMCRWLEFERALEGEGGIVSRSWFKFLVPEKFLKPDQDPLKHVLETWIKSDENEPVRGQGDASQSKTCWMFLAGRGKRTPVMKAKQLDYQRGKLVCPSAVHQRKTFDSFGHDQTTDLTIWPHKDIPSGVAAAMIEETWHEKKNGKFVAKYVYELHFLKKRP